MEKKKIEDFITRLSDPNLPEDQQSFILQSEDDDVSAGDNTGASCTNRSILSCGGNNNNGNCTNYSVCGGATNYGNCKNFDPVEIDTDCIYHKNPDCGG